MIIPGSSYWNIAIGREKGDVLKDEEGMRTMKVLGENMAWLLKKIKDKSKKSKAKDEKTKGELKSNSQPDFAKHAEVIGFSMKNK